MIVLSLKLTGCAASKDLKAIHFMLEHEYAYTQEEYETHHNHDCHLPCDDECLSIIKKRKSNTIKRKWFNLVKRELQNKQHTGERQSLQSVEDRG